MRTINVIPQTRKLKISFSSHLYFGKEILSRYSLKTKDAARELLVNDAIPLSKEIEKIQALVGVNAIIEWMG